MLVNEGKQVQILSHHINNLLTTHVEHRISTQGATHAPPFNNSVQRISIAKGVKSMQYHSEIMTNDDKKLWKLV